MDVVFFEILQNIRIAQYRQNNDMMPTVAQPAISRNIMNPYSVQSYVYKLEKPPINIDIIIRVIEIFKKI